MSEQYAVITGADSNQVDSTWESQGLSAFETSGKISLSALGRREYKKEIIGSFKQGSGGRSYRYYSYNNLKHAQQDASVDSYRLPVYGVRGSSDISRAIGYACVYISSSKDMAGLDFYSHVFGSRYLTEEEIRTAPDPAALTNQPPVMPELKIRPENRERVFAIVERLNKIQEIDPNSKLLIVMDDALTASMDLLKDVYLLLPRKMRLNYGFATNISVKTYEELFQQQSLPIQLLTMDTEVYRNSTDKIKNLDPLLSVLDLRQMPAAQSTLWKQMDRFLGKGINRTNDLLFAYAEQEVIRQHNNVPSMKFYPEILAKYLDNLVLWWKNTKLNSLAELEKAYEEQQILMEDDLLREEAVGGFYLHMLPEKEFAKEIAFIQVGKETGAISPEVSAKAEKSLDFVRKKLGYEKILKAVEFVISEMNQKKESALRKAQEKHDQQIAGVQYDMDQLRLKFDDSARQNRQLEQKNRQLEEQNQKLRTEAGRYSTNGFEKSSYDRLKDDYDHLQERFNNKQKELVDESDRLEKKARIGLILAIVFGALLAAAAVAWFMTNSSSKKKQAQQEQEIARLQADIENRETEQEQAQSYISSLESELLYNQQQKESAEQQVASLTSEKELLESEKAARLAVPDETEAEGPGETIAESASNGYTDANGDFIDDITQAKIASVDSDGDGYDDNTGWFINSDQRDDNGLVKDVGTPIRNVIDTSGGEPKLISTIQDNSIKKLFALRTDGTISCFDANGDWIDDLSQEQIAKPEEGYHEETGWLTGWYDGKKSNEAGELVDAAIDGMDEQDAQAKPICDYTQIKKLNESEDETEMETVAQAPTLAGGATAEAQNAATQ